MIGTYDSHQVILIDWDITPREVKLKAYGLTGVEGKPFGTGFTAITVEGRTVGLVPRWFAEENGLEIV